MEFKDLLGKQTLVSRTLLTEQRQVTQRTKTEDGTIKRAGQGKDADGKHVSIIVHCSIKFNLRSNTVYHVLNFTISIVCPYFC